MEDIGRGNTALWWGCFIGRQAAFTCANIIPNFVRPLNSCSSGLALARFQSPMVTQVLMVPLRTYQLKSKFSLRVSVLARFTLLVLSELLFNKYI
jgi:hypothetical protein